MLRRGPMADSALGEEDPGAPSVSSSSSSGPPPSHRHMHELESDGEDEYEGEADITIDEDDIDHNLSAQLQARASNAAAVPAFAAAAASSSSSPAAASSSALRDLPSYHALMSSLQPGNESSSLSLSPGSAAASSSAIQRDADENVGFLQDERDSAAGDAGAGDSDDDDDDASASNPPLSASFDSLLARAMRLEASGRTRRASHLYLLCLERHRYEHTHQHMIATCLKRLGDICYRNKKYKEALQFRSAERMLFEASLLQVVQSDAAGQAAPSGNSSDATSRTMPGAAGRGSSSSSTSSSAVSASSSRDAAAAAAAVASARAVLSAPSADPLSLPHTPLTPASLLVDEERALRFERLARVFFEEKNVAMARAYALKAIEIRREIKDKYGDPSTMTPSQLQLRQLAVLGQEQYESTLRTFRGEQTGGAQQGGETTPAEAAARSRALQLSMRQALQALSSGELESMPSAPVASRTQAAAAADDGDDSKEESAASLRSRRAASAAREAAKRQQLRSSGASVPSIGEAEDASSSGDLTSLVKESTTVKPARRRMLLVTGMSVLLLLLLAVWSAWPMLEGRLFPAVRVGRGSGNGPNARRYAPPPTRAATPGARGAIQ